MTAGDKWLPFECIQTIDYNHARPKLLLPEYFISHGALEYNWVWLPWQCLLLGTSSWRFIYNARQITWSGILFKFEMEVCEHPLY